MGFVISKVSWHTQKQGAVTPREQVILRYWTLVNFLQENKLTLRRLASSQNDINDDFLIHSDDLTEKGMILMKKSYDKWLKKIDRGMVPTDVSLLAKSLAEMPRSLSE